MKRFLLVPLLSGLFLFQGCSVLTESREDRAARLERESQLILEGIDALDFKIDIERMIPMRGTARHVDNYSVKVKDGHIVSHLPYIGRAWDLPYGGGHALNYESDIDDSAVFVGDDGSYTVRLLIKTDEDTHVYTFQIYLDGNAYLLVQSRNREPINFSGHYSFDE